MIVPEGYPPTGSGGLGCGGNCGCHSCRKGLGETEPPTLLDSVWSALTTTLPFGSAGLPVWVLVGIGLVAAARMMPKTREYRGR